MGERNEIEKEGHIGMPKNWIGERNEREKECQRVREREKEKEKEKIQTEEKKMKGENDVKRRKGKL